MNGKVTLIGWHISFRYEGPVCVRISKIVLTLGNNPVVN